MILALDEVLLLCRNGSYKKFIIDDDGHKLSVDIPRDREGEYEPKLIPKGVRRFSGFDDKVISLYSRGMTMSEIQGHLEEIYHTEVSKELISTVTDGYSYRSLGETKKLNGSDIKFKGKHLSAGLRFDLQIINFK